MTRVMILEDDLEVGWSGKDTAVDCGCFCGSFKDDLTRRVGALLSGSIGEGPRTRCLAHG